MKQNEQHSSNQILWMKGLKSTKWYIFNQLIYSRPNIILQNDYSLVFIMIYLSTLIFKREKKIMKNTFITQVHQQRKK